MGFTSAFKGLKSFSFIKSEDSLLCMQKPFSGPSSEPDGVNISAVQASCIHVAVCFAKLTGHTERCNFFLKSNLQREFICCLLLEPTNAQLHFTTYSSSSGDATTLGGFWPAL
jgi:hypothetical protein